jgi:hypothetical protein
VKKLQRERELSRPSHGFNQLFFGIGLQIQTKTYSILLQEYDAANLIGVGCRAMIEAVELGSKV